MSACVKLKEDIVSVPYCIRFPCVKLKTRAQNGRAYLPMATAVASFRQASAQLLRLDSRVLYYQPIS